jgi:hypothetical protein
MSTFMYALKAEEKPDTRRQYPRRFQYFLIFLGIPGTLEEQAKSKTKFDVDTGQPYVIYRLSKGKGQKRRNSRIYNHQLLQGKEVILHNEWHFIKLEEDISWSAIRKKVSSRVVSNGLIILIIVIVSVKVLVE